MKLLFVCKWNAGRSQMAEELFNKYSNDHQAISAGTHVNKFQFQGNKLKDFAHHVVTVLKEKGIDASEKTQTQLTATLADSADKIIFLTDKKDLPKYLINSKKVTYWKIEDGDGKDYEFHINMRNQIDKLVKELVSQIG